LVSANCRPPRMGRLPHCDMPVGMNSAFNTFLLVLAAIFPVVNPPGSALVFLGLTRGVKPEVRRIVAWRVARNSLLVLVGALILELYGISIPVLRVAGGIIVAVAGWKLLNEGSDKDAEASGNGVSNSNPLDQAFYPLTLPLMTGPGTIAVVTSLGLSRVSDTSSMDAIVLASSLAAVVIDHHFCVFCLRGSRPAIAWIRGDRCRSAAIRVHSLLSRSSDSLVWGKRAPEIGYSFRFVSCAVASRQSGETTALARAPISDATAPFVCAIRGVVFGCRRRLVGRSHVPLPALELIPARVVVNLCPCS
jgi:multiple antibiotic resistance protein